MPPKKLSGKFEQLTFSLSPDLKRTVQEKVKQDGINLSGLISGYLSEWVSGKVSDKEDPISSQLCSITADQHVQQLKSEISGLKSEMAELKDIISASIRIDTNQLIPIEAPQIKETVKPIESPKTDITLDTYQSVSIRNDEPGPEPEPMNPEDTISMGDIVNRIVGREVSSDGTDKQEYNRTSKRVKGWMQKQGIKPIRVGKYTHYPVNTFNRYLSEKNIQ